METNQDDPKTNAMLDALEEMRLAKRNEIIQYLMVFDDQTMADFLANVHIPVEEAAYDSILEKAIEAEAKYLHNIIVANNQERFK
jgi:hypothetical protein